MCRFPLRGATAPIVGRPVVPYDDENQAGIVSGYTTDLWVGALFLLRKDATLKLAVGQKDFWHWWPYYGYHFRDESEVESVNLRPLDSPPEESHTSHH